LAKQDRRGKDEIGGWYYLGEKKEETVRKSKNTNWEEKKEKKIQLIKACGDH